MGPSGSRDLVVEEAMDMAGIILVHRLIRSSRFFPANHGLPLLIVHIADLDAAHGDEDCQCLPAAILNCPGKPYRFNPGVLS